jgi:hypothetical protein
MNAINSFLLLKLRCFGSEASTDGGDFDRKSIDFQFASSKVTGESHFRCARQAEIRRQEPVDLISFAIGGHATAFDHFSWKKIGNRDQAEAMFKNF